MGTRRSGISVPRVLVGHELVSRPWGSACPTEGTLLASSGVIDVAMVVSSTDPGQRAVGFFSEAGQGVVRNYCSQSVPPSDIMPGLIQILGMVIVVFSQKVAVVNGGAEGYPVGSIVDLLPSHILNPDGKAFVGSGEIPACPIPLGKVILMLCPIPGSCGYDKIAVTGRRRAWGVCQLIKDAGLPVQTLNH
ncbi:hypothetical protein ES708_09284 [subsurface metagenome]